MNMWQNAMRRVLDRRLAQLVGADGPAPEMTVAEWQRLPEADVWAYGAWRVATRRAAEAVAVPEEQRASP